VVFPSEVVKTRRRISLTLSAIFHFSFLQFAHGVKRSGSGAEAEFYPKKASAVAFKERVGNKFLSPLGNRSRRRQERMSQLLVVVLAHVLEELGDVEVNPLMAQIAERQPASRRSEWLHPRCVVWFSSFLPRK